MGTGFELRKGLKTLPTALVLRCCPMSTDLWQSLRDEAAAAIARLPEMDAALLEETRLAWLGRQGKLAGALKEIGKLSKSERPAAGSALNTIKEDLTLHLANRKTALEEKAILNILDRPADDVGESGFAGRVGSLHPLEQIWREMEDIFVSLGFQVADGAEVETDYHNFEALNIPSDHPARDDHDSLYLAPGHLLRTHTSTVQIRVMSTQKPPIQIISIGRTYRRDEVDPRHSAVFHQCEALHVDKHLNMSHLKGMLAVFFESLFGRKLNMRLRPSFFPFTEPSAEVDIQCPFCMGDGCKVCSGAGWIEVLGCGMVDPRVLKGVGIDPEAYTGYAFGIGLERMAMLRHFVHDIRLFYENDLDFLRQFV